MTYKERLQIAHPECINEKGECKGCPEDYGYCSKYSDEDDRKKCVTIGMI